MKKYLNIGVEYEIEEISKALLKNNFKSPILYPVIYSDERYDVTQVAVNYFKFTVDRSKTDSVDGLSLVKPVIRKASDWSCEKEWRIIDASNYFGRDIDYAFLPFIKPKAVYIGYNTPKDYELKIIDICKYKEIDLHKITLNDNGSKSSLINTPLTLHS